MRLWRVELLYVALTGVVLLLGVWWIPAGVVVTTDSYSPSFEGRKVLFTVLRRLEGNVSRSTERLVPRPGERDRILILGPIRNPTEAEWDVLFEEVLQGASLVFAVNSAQPEVSADPFGIRIRRTGLVPADVSPVEEGLDVATGDGSGSQPVGESENPTTPPVEKPLKPVPPGQQNAPSSTPAPGPGGNPFLDEEEEPMIFPATTDVVPGVVNWETRGELDLDDDAGWEVLLSAAKSPQVVRRRLGSGTVVFLASDDIFSNEAMIDPSRAVLAWRLIELAPVDEEGLTWVDETLNSSGVPKVLGMLFDPLFRPLTLQLALVAVLFGWLGSRRFGPQLPPQAGRRRSIVEHAQALGNLYYRASAGSWAVECFYEYFKVELRRIGGGGLRPDAYASLARQSGASPEKVEKILRQAARVGESELPNAKAGRLLWNLSRLLSKLRQEKM